MATGKVAANFHVAENIMSNAFIRISGNNNIKNGSS